MLQGEFLLLCLFLLLFLSLAACTEKSGKKEKPQGRKNGGTKNPKKISPKNLTDKKIKNQLNLVKNAVIAGEKLHHALHHCSHFPKHARHFIAIGENADALPLMMEKVAHYYTQKFDDLLDHLSKLIEPVIMIFVASLVSGLIVAMYLPVFKMGSVI